MHSLLLVGPEAMLEFPAMGSMHRQNEFPQTKGGRPAYFNMTVCIECECVRGGYT